MPRLAIFGFSMFTCRQSRWMAIPLLAGSLLSGSIWAAAPDDATGAPARLSATPPDPHSISRVSKTLRNALSLTDRGALAQSRPVRVIVEFDQAEVASMAETRRNQLHAAAGAAGSRPRGLVRARHRRRRAVRTAAAGYDHAS